jgi:hypothetical protein
MFSEHFICTASENGGARNLKKIHQLTKSCGIEMGLSYLTNPKDSRGMASEEHFDGIYQCRGASQARDYKMLM